MYTFNTRYVELITREHERERAWHCLVQAPKIVGLVGARYITFRNEDRWITRLRAEANGLRAPQQDEIRQTFCAHPSQFRRPDSPLAPAPDSEEECPPDSRTRIQLSSADAFTSYIDVSFNQRYNEHIIRFSTPDMIATIPDRRYGPDLYVAYKKPDSLWTKLTKRGVKNPDDYDLFKAVSREWRQTVRPRSTRAEKNLSLNWPSLLPK